MQDGLRRMYGEGKTPEESNVIYYLTVYNEPIQQPKEPEDVDVEGILRGMHLHLAGEHRGLDARARRARSCSASGVGVPWALEAQQLLADDWGVAADVWSVTSWNELRRDGLAADEQEFLRPDGEQPVAVGDPVASRAPRARSSRCRDYMRAVQDQIRAVGPGHLRHARRRRLRLLRHPSGGAPLLPHRRPVGRGADAAAARQARARSTPTSRAEAAEKYRLDDVTAGTSGNAGGES